MTDFLTKEERSRRMASIRSKNTVPEMALRRTMHALGLRYRINDRRLPGKPDIVLTRHRAVVFVHGCFWHRHCGCKIASTPKSNTGFWLKKFEDNVTRDSRTREALIGLGWRVFVVWECELGSQQKVSGVAMRLREQFLSDSKALHCIKVVSDRFEPEYLPGSGKI